MAAVTVAVAGEVQGVGCSCDHLTVSVVVLLEGASSPTLLLYDTRGLLLPSPDAPFAQHALNTCGGAVRGLAWNPMNANTLMVTYASGGLAMYTLNVESGNLGGANCDTLPPAVGLSSITSTSNASSSTSTSITSSQVGIVSACWSPKGKQMVAARRDGSLAQYKPDLKEAKSWAGPPGGLRPVSVTWLSTYEFLVGYRWRPPLDQSLHTGARLYRGGYF